MSRMSEQHDDLSTVHAILLGQRQVATINSLRDSVNAIEKLKCDIRVSCIDDLLLEIEAAGVVWPDNVTSLNAFTKEYAFDEVDMYQQCQCGGDIHPEHGPWGVTHG